MIGFSHFPVIASVGGLFGNPKYRVNLHYHILFLVISHSVRLLSGSCLTRYRPNAQVMFTEVDDGNTNEHRNVGTQYSKRIQISLMGTYNFWSH